MNSDKVVNLPFYARIALILTGLYLLVMILFIAKSIIVPIIFSAIFAMLLSPVVSFFIRHKINRIVAITFTMVPAILLGAGISFWLISELSMFSESFPVLLKKLNVTMNYGIHWVSGNFNIPEKNITDWVGKTQKELISNSTSAISYAVVTMGNVLVIIFLIPVYVFMILYYQPLIIEFFHQLFKRNDNFNIADILKKIKVLIQSYLVGLIVEAALVATLNSVSLLIIGVEYAILFGVLGAILNVIPYLGGIIAVAMPMLMAIVTKDSFTSAFLVLIAYSVIQFIDNNYFVPKIVASKVKLNALISVIIVLAGGALWGIPGMFLSIPLIAIVKLIFDSIEELKPWGYLLGDTMPSFTRIKLPFAKHKN